MDKPVEVHSHDPKGRNHIQDVKVYDSTSVHVDPTDL